MLPILHKYTQNITHFRFHMETPNRVISKIDNFAHYLKSNTYM